MVVTDGWLFTDAEALVERPRVFDVLEFTRGKDFVADQRSTSSNNAGTLAVAVTPDGKYAFVSGRARVRSPAS